MNWAAVSANSSNTQDRDIIRHFKSLFFRSHHPINSRNKRNLDLAGTMIIKDKSNYKNLPYFSLQPNLSTEREVVLDNVDFSTSGQYRCEVSGDAPMFQTAHTEGLLFVVGEFQMKTFPILVNKNLRRLAGLGINLTGVKPNQIWIEDQTKDTFLFMRYLRFHT